mgnify:CR=1 FL=1
MDEEALNGEVTTEAELWARILPVRIYDLLALEPIVVGLVNVVDARADSCDI